MCNRLDLHSLGDALLRRYAAMRPTLVAEVANAGLSLSVLPAHGQAPLPGAAPARASTRPIPGGKAFELYLSVESSTANTARITPPVQQSTNLTWEEGRTAQMWTLPCPDLNRVVVRLRRGEEMTDDEARDVLRLVEEAVTA
ncbi:MAG: hypothetical protein AB7F22_07115 [Reyranella sp.]|uniref:hypothetical protein n=1 Tax=Reyranella sp. TaxID=1929291 RepID=UPI003D096A7D